MQQIERKPLFDLGQVVATPAHWPLSKNPDRTPWISSRTTSQATGAKSPTRTRGKTNSAWREVFRLMSSYRTTTGDRVWVITRKKST